MTFTGETETIEYKTSTGELKVACNSIVAMLNKHGIGTVYFGVKDNGEVIGQKITNDTVRDISRVIYESIKPQIYPTVAKVDIDEKSIIKVEFNGEDRPYSSKGKYYIRVSDEDREINPTELKRFFKQFDTPENWEAIKSDTPSDSYEKDSFEDFKTKAVEAGRLPVVQEPVVNILNRLGLTSGDYLNVAGNLLFGTNPGIVLKAGIFATEHKLTFIDQQTKEGNIFQLIRFAEKYIMQNIHWRSEIIGFERIETPEIPAEVVREALANSFVHAIYHADTNHEICIYPNRITIYNPGVYASPNPPDDYIKKDIPSVIRNRIISKILYLSHDFENFGSGFKRIDSFCQDANVRYGYELMQTGFLFTLYRSSPNSVIESVSDSYVNSPNNTSNNERSADLTETEKTVMLIMQMNASITREELSLKISKTVRTVQRIINSMKDKGYIQRSGSKWKLLKQLPSDDSH
ncbi:MAG: putative DNA binding domain-containing protein [Succinivibrionaceae bacterium]|nr:putative DNA binding domain-containing protein [Succinivibrionaceae bacterium]